MHRRWSEAHQRLACPASRLLCAAKPYPGARGRALPSAVTFGFANIEAAIAKLMPSPLLNLFCGLQRGNRACVHQHVLRRPRQCLDRAAWRQSGMVMLMRSISSTEAAPIRCPKPWRES